MIKSAIKFMSLGVLFNVAMLSSCTKKLDLYPTNGITSETVYSTPEGYKQVLAKVYGSWATTGNAGPAGAADVFFPGSDEGQNSDFFRTLWCAQELSTDEAVTRWGDAGLQDFHNLNFVSTNVFLAGLYYKSLYQITLVNEYLRQSTDEKLSSRGIAGADAEAIRKTRSEVRFIRAYQYSVLMDVFGNPPFVTEASLIGGANPPQIKRADLFNYVESELKAIETELPAPRSNEYGRADQAAAWALLARIYLNAEVYSGTAKYTEAVAYSSKVIAAGYSLMPDYRQLMLADNNLRPEEFILTINYDGINTKGYGGTTFLTHCAVGPGMNASDYGIGGGWEGMRTTKAFVNKFPDNSGSTDKRAQFFQTGHSIDINNIGTFTDGFGITKYRNVTKDGMAGSSLDYADIDMPIFRLAEMYLVYAEAVKRGGTGGDISTAVGYINALRMRAFGDNSGDINSGELTLDFILDERARELYWEGFRRSDLIRFDKFVESTYLWPFKGGVPSGTAVDIKYKLYPLPSSDLLNNPNLVQNPGFN